MSKTKKKEIDLESLICKIEGLLDIEIQKLPTTLQILPPEKRVDFISKTLPVVVKYRENHSGGGIWELPKWGE